MFDTAGHSIFLRRLLESFGTTGMALDWSSILPHRKNSACSAAVTDLECNLTPVTCSVPQWSVLSRVLFLLYTSDGQQVVMRRSLLPHLYADDTKIYDSCRPRDANLLQQRVSTFFDEVASSMRANQLQLNTAKTEILLFDTRRRRCQLPIIGFKVGYDAIFPSRLVYDLGNFLDSDLMMSQVTRTVGPLSHSTGISQVSQRASKVVSSIKF